MGLTLVYVHLNRLIKAQGLNMMIVVGPGPGHGGPGIVAHSYLEGSYTEHCPANERNRNGMHRLFRQFSWPGVPALIAPADMNPCKSAPFAQTRGNRPACRCRSQSVAPGGSRFTHLACAVRSSKRLGRPRPIPSNASPMQRPPP